MVEFGCYGYSDAHWFCEDKMEVSTRSLVRVGCKDSVDYRINRLTLRRDGHTMQFEIPHSMHSFVRLTSERPRETLVVGEF